MKMSTLSFQFHLLKCTTNLANSTSHPSFLIPNIPQPKHYLYPTISSPPSSRKCNNIGSVNGIGKSLITQQVLSPKCHMPSKEESPPLISTFGNSRFVIVGVVSVGVVLFLMGLDDQKAMALGPEGPLMEEFWDNVRRYALYALTVSTGALWAVFQPIYELLKNPISAVLILTILGGGFFIVSQVVSAMVGLSDFTYDYGYISNPLINSM